MPTSSHLGVVVLGLCLAAARPLSAQWPTGGGAAPGQQPQGQQQGQPGQNGGPGQPQTPPRDPFGYDAFAHPFVPFDNTRAPEQGFPSFAPGIYPPPPKGWMQAPPWPESRVSPPTLPMPPTNPDWPSWLKARLDRELPYTPDQAVLVRDADRVWLRVPEEEAFVPLYFFDKLRAITAGTAIEVRQTGAFQVVFHGGSRLSSRGTAAVEVEELDEQRVHIDLRQLTWIEMVCIGRAHELALPDGSVLQVEAAAPEAGRAEIRIERRDEPGWFGGRADLFNYGVRPVLWHTPFGDHVLAPGHRATMFLQPSPQPIAAGLQHDAARVQQIGTTLVAEPTGADAAVSWRGVRFRLPPGSKLTIDPLLGDPFAEAAAPTPRPTEKQQP